MTPSLLQHLRTQHGPQGDAYVRGFLAGLQCNPEPMVPSIWMNHILWAGTDGSFDSAIEARAVVEALVKEWESAERAMRNGRPMLSAFLTGENDVATLERAYIWAAGFFDAAYLDGYDFIGQSEGDQSAIAPFEIILSAGVQRGYAGLGNSAHELLQAEHLVSLLRDELVLQVVRSLDRDLLRAYKHFRGMDPIDIPLLEED